MTNLLWHTKCFVSFGWYLYPRNLESRITRVYKYFYRIKYTKSAGTYTKKYMYRKIDILQDKHILHQDFRGI